MSLPVLKTTSRDEAVGLLSPALGEEKAGSTVDAAASALGLTSPDWSSAQFRGVFAHIAQEPGLVGITARVVSRRLRHSSDVQATGAHSLDRPGAPLPASPGSSQGLRTVETSLKPIQAIADLLAQALGAETATRSVDRAAKALGFGETVHFSEALKVLEHLTREPGLVGIAAQFAKTRLHLLTW